MHTLLSEIQRWSVVGHAATMQRFVARNGKAYAVGDRPVRYGPAKMCFQNSTHYALENGCTYVEGYFYRPDLPILIHHAWVTVDGVTAIDPTIKNNADCFYVGVSFQTDRLLSELERLDHYGLLDTGCGLNTALMFSIDQELQAITRAVKPHRAFQWQA